MRENKRIKLSCGEAGDVISAVTNSVNALLATGGKPNEIREVAQRLNTEAGWPQEIVDAYIERTLKEAEETEKL